MCLRRPIRAHLIKEATPMPSARALARATVLLAGGSRPELRSALRRRALGTRRRLPTHARWLPHAPLEWKATPPCVPARILMDRLVLRRQIAAGPGISEGLRYLGPLAWQPAYEIPHFRPVFPFQSLSLVGLCPAIFPIGPGSPALGRHHPRRGWVIHHIQPQSCRSSGILERQA